MARPVPPIKSPGPAKNARQPASELSDVADALYSLKLEATHVRKALEKTPEARRLAEIEAERKRLENYVIDTVRTDEGVSGVLGHVVVYTEDVPILDKQEDNPKGLFYEYIKEHDAFFLLKGDMDTKAVKELLADGQKIPGVTIFKNKKVSLTKTKKRSR